MWDTRAAAAAAMTVAGTRPAFQAALRGAGVEVIEFDELTPAGGGAVLRAAGADADFWECGGGLAAPALEDGWWCTT